MTNGAFSGSPCPQRLYESSLKMESPRTMYSLKDRCLIQHGATERGHGYNLACTTYSYYMGHTGSPLSPFIGLGVMEVSCHILCDSFACSRT